MLRYKSYLILTLVIIPKFAWVQNLWTLGTADNLDKFHCTAGVFQPVRFGLTNKIEVSTLALSNILVFNLSLKMQWWERNILIATKHGIYNPNFGLTMAKKTGYKNWVGDTVFIPKTIILKNELLISRYFKTCQCCPSIFLFTGKIGMLFNSVKNNNLFVPIDHTLMYPRTQIYNNHYLWNIGFDLEGPLFDWIDFSVDFDYFRIFGTGTRSIEHKLVTVYHFSARWDFFAGYKLALCPEAPSKNLYFRPFIDAVYKFHIPTKPKNGLWKGRADKHY